MELRVNGKPYIFKHRCRPGEQGKDLSLWERQSFVTDCLIEAFEMKGTKCVLHTPDFNSGAQFSYQKYGITFCCIVRFAMSQQEGCELVKFVYSDEFKEKFPQLIDGFNKHGSIPLLFIAEALNEAGENVNIISGGECRLKFTPIQCAHKYEHGHPRLYEIKDYVLYNCYAECWETGNFDFLDQYCSDSFDADSDLAFLPITNIRVMKEHIKWQREEWKTRGFELSARVVTRKSDKKHGIIFNLNGKDICFTRLRIREGRIEGSYTEKLTDDYEPWNGKCELYQTHGDHHAPFITDEELMPKLQQMFRESLYALGCETKIVLDDDRVAFTSVSALKFSGEFDDLSYLLLVAYDADSQKNLFVTCYPYLDGTPVKVRILEVNEWDNGVEATIKCRYERDDEDFEFHFFATDYFMNKEMYELGKEIEIALCASSMKTQIAPKGFDFEGQKALDFLAKIGQEPKYKENGEVEPVHFSMENLVAFIPNDDKAPDMAEFQSPAESCEYEIRHFDGKPIEVRTITLNKDTNLKVPLYFDINEVVEDGEGIMGLLWLTGRLANPCMAPAINEIHLIKQGKEYLEISSRFADRLHYLMHRYDINEVCNLSEIIAISENLSMPDDCSLMCAMVGNSNRFQYRCFCIDALNALAISSITDSHGVIAENIELTSPLKKITVKPTRAAVWEAFLLEIVGTMLTCCGVRNPKTYILTHDDAVRCARSMVNGTSYLKFLPIIRLNDDNSGYLHVYVWLNGALYREVYTVALHNGRLNLIFDDIYKSEMQPESDYILFRE